MRCVDLTAGWRERDAAVRLLRESLPPGTRLAAAGEAPFGLNDRPMVFESPDLRLKMRTSDIEEVFSGLGCELELKTRAGTLVSSPDGIRLGGRRFRFKRDGEMAYSLQKTQYKGKTPYCVAACYLQGLWPYLDDGFRRAGWVKVAE